MTVPSIFNPPANDSNAGSSGAPPSTNNTNNNQYNHNASKAAPTGNAPTNPGLSHNLPANIKDIASLDTANVIAWTKLDPALESELGRFICVRTYGPFLLPCFWCHLCCLWPCLWAQSSAMTNSAQAQYWVLTDYELKIVSLDHDSSCIPGLCNTGDIVKSVPLENITDCGSDARGTGRLNECAGDVPTIYVDTASSGSGQARHEAVGFGLENYKWFIQEVLAQRNRVKGIAPTANSMVRPNNGNNSNNNTNPSKSTQERLADIEQLKNQGIITQAEYDQKRKDIIASI